MEDTNEIKKVKIKFKELMKLIPTTLDNCYYYILNKISRF